MKRDQFQLPIHAKLIVDLFAGGGGMSTAIEWALGRSPDIAVNHDDDALSMHRANHPQAEHYIADVFEVCPYTVTRGLLVGLLHLSPDCTHHSQAAGGQPRSKKRRALAWVGYRWAGQVAPDVITLENVVQVLKWGPLIAKRDPATGRVVKLDGSVAAKGERVLVQEQFLIPDPMRAGRTWRRFVALLEGLGYQVEVKELCAADYGAPTTRERLFMVARRDGLPIVWPAPTHAKQPTKGLKRWRAAAECIDWSIPCPSIFDRDRPLAEATMRRIAKGTVRYVLESADPFIVPIAHYYSGIDRVHDIGQPMQTITAHPKGGAFAVAAPTVVPVTHQGGDRTHAITEPLRTITAANRGETAISAPVLVQAGYGERPGQSPRALDIESPLGTVTAGGVKHALASAQLVKFRGQAFGSAVDAPMPTITSGGGSARPAGCAHALGLATAYLAQANDGNNTNPGHDLRRPVSTITNKGSQQQLVTARLTTLQRRNAWSRAGAPLPTVLEVTETNIDSEGDVAAGKVDYQLSPEQEAGALRVAAFLMRYYGTGGQWGDLRDPMQTITTRDRLALVTVTVRGTPYVVVDIGLRMLQPPELYRGQGFPRDYRIDVGHDGRRFTKSAQVRMCGNSVSPYPAMALIRANVPALSVQSTREQAQRDMEMAA
ncbi:DNA cytosine methyltransferase [Chitinimonas koreensis]|uniref:DNA cytosine methyltransferase n=1 Tax=Chitinimonas koreensis TaxID=356302 RepID=UPI0004034A25|nr:DNA cytosine methyltransferase [Chitinimonas koreensis]QNM96415.1 DNA cytosine methyltransferase [Chitinimonas koreensis]